MPMVCVCANIINNTIIDQHNALTWPYFYAELVSQQKRLNHFMHEKGMFKVKEKKSKDKDGISNKSKGKQTDDNGQTNSPRNDSTEL